MDSEERKKSAKLIRKSSSANYVKKRIFKSRLLASKAVTKAQKHLAPLAASGQNLEFSPEMLKACAEINAITSFAPEEHTYLQKHLRHLTLSLIHQSIRIMEQNKRGMPQISDIDFAAQNMGLEVPYGAGTGELLPVRTGGRNAAPGVGGKMFSIRRDKEVDVKSLIRREPAPVVYDVCLAAHWLAIDGVQPTSPQNPPPDFLRRMAQLAGTKKNLLNAAEGPPQLPLPSQLKPEDTTAASSSTETASKSKDVIPGSLSHPRVMQAAIVEKRPHEISQELMLYFRELTEACVGANENRRHEALDNAAQDTGLQPLLPYLVTFIAEGVRVNVSNNNLAILIYLMRLTKALIDNQHISLEAYLHLIVPTVITCILCRQLCAKPITDNHWALRDYAAKQLVTLCNRYNTLSNGLYNRITRELYRALCTWIDGRAGSGDSKTGEHVLVHSSANTNETPAGGPPSPEVVSSACGATELPQDQESGLAVSEKTDQVAGNKSHTQQPPKPADNAGKGGASLGAASSSLNTLYGILIALSEFGPSCLRVLVFPLLPSLCRRLTAMLENQRPQPAESSRPAASQSSSQGSFDQPTSVLLLHRTVEDRDAFTTPTTASVSTVPPVMPGSLSPADMRSMDSLRTLMANRLGPLLSEWRARQDLSVTAEAYKADYGALANSLLAAIVRTSTGGQSAGSALLVTKPQPPG
ncbi:hypothetical protein AAHC03_013722 [Spirometra sp. Aus1]